MILADGFTGFEAAAFVLAFGLAVAAIIYASNRNRKPPIDNIRHRTIGSDPE